MTMQVDSVSANVTMKRCNLGMVINFAVLKSESENYSPNWPIEVVTTATGAFARFFFSK